MILSPDDQMRFKRFAAWVRKDMPRLANDAVVVDTMHDLVGIPKKAVRDALQWGQGPKIRVKLDLICRGRAAGCFRPEEPEYVDIEEQVVNAYEQKLGPPARSTGLHTVPHPGIILLHELVHWADWKVDESKTSVDKTLYHDVGSKWEWLVFATFLPEMQGD